MLMAGENDQMPLIRRTLTSLLVIVIVAFGLRLGYAWNETAKMPRDVVATVPFQTETGHIAYSLAEGKGFASPFQRDSGPTAWLTPIYPLLVAGTFNIFGVYTRASFFAIVFLNIVFSALTCVPIFYAGKRVTGLGVGAGAAWLWALFPNAILIPFGWIWDTSLAALLAAIILWATVALADRRRWRYWIGYGLLWGVTLMTNAALLSVFPVLLGWLIWHRRVRGRFRLWKPAMAAIVALICCIPWTVRNFVVFHRFIPFRSNLSYELYVGNNQNYDERHRGRLPVITQDLETLRYLRMGEIAFMDEERRKALQFIESHPRMEMRLLGWRFVDFWMGVVDPWRTFITSDSWLIRGILFGNFVSSMGALLGMVALFLKRNQWAIAFAAYPVVFPVLYYVTHTSLRYRHPIDPVVLLLTAISGNAIWGWGQSVFRHDKRTAAGGPVHSSS
jgi:4-amino-4-deoxy-L-arabinose transferase-like glycosyltransferase